MARQRGSEDVTDASRRDTIGASLSASRPLGSDTAAEWIYVMLYAVYAKLIPDRAPEFHARLTDGSIASQRPDGAEIVAAMKRARAASDGMVRWTETCYCPTPLQHERATVLDRYFTGIETKVIDNMRPSTVCR